MSVDIEGDIAKFLISPVRADLNMPSEGAPKNLFAGDMPPTPDFAVAVIRYEGRDPSEVFANPLHTRHPRIQVTVRHTSSLTALTVADDILKILVAVKDQVINGTMYQRIKSQGEPFEVGPDPQNRQRAMVNFEVSYHDNL